MQGLKVNGESIGVDEIRAETARLRGEAEAEAPGRELSFEQRVYLRNEATGRLIERLLIGQEAARLDLSATDKYPNPSPLREAGIISTIRLFPAVVTNPKVKPCTIRRKRNMLTNVASG